MIKLKDERQYGKSEMENDHPRLHLRSMEREIINKEYFFLHRLGLQNASIKKVYLATELLGPPIALRSGDDTDKT